MTATVARVLVDSPLPQLDRLFDYAIPQALADRIGPGMRVRVPLRSAGRVADGLVVEVGDHGDFAGELSELEALVSEVPALAPEIWRLARAVADRSAGGASDVIRLAVPKRQVRVEKAWIAARDAAPAEDDAHEDSGAEPDTVMSRPTDRIGESIASGSRLAVAAVPRVVELAPSGGAPGRWVGEWATLLADAAAAALTTGGSAILCVPDYRDQHQLVAALEQVIPADRIVQLDARRSGPDRYRGFLSCLGDEPLVIVGNRSVMYAPARQLALIAMWDDGDPLHAEPLAPYAHARDVALVRQGQQGSALWFAGHSRSTEVQRLVELGYLGELKPERPYAPRILPTAQQAPQDRYAAIARIPSSAWREARTALESGPVLVQVARPGYAPRLACTECGNSARCTRCGGPLATRSSGAVPACTWCGALAVDWTCSLCGGTHLRTAGQGATRTAEDLGRAFPGVRVVVADGERPLLDVGSEPALVVATRGAEPVAAGGYRAVLLLDGERMLARESLRVGEDCLRWWSNAAALAAVGAPVVLVGVGGALASAMVTWQPATYAAAELADRRRLRFPPAVRVATVTGDQIPVDAAIAAVSAVDGTDVLGPVEVEDGTVRAIVRFDYARGEAVAAALRAETVRAASARRRRIPTPAGRPTPSRPPSLPRLRVRCDDTDPFVE